MLNPSIADAECDDPTIRRCIGFAMREGFSRLSVVNLFANRATDPSLLRDFYQHRIRGFEPSSNEIAAWVHEFMAPDDRVIVAAWGSLQPGWLRRMALPRVRELMSLAGECGCPLLCLGTTKNGHPRHPLYVRGDARLAKWGEDEEER
jgi:hypothetical protein